MAWRLLCAEYPSRLGLGQYKIRGPFAMRALAHDLACVQGLHCKPAVRSVVRTI
jgi:hypothetical protein